MTARLRPLGTVALAGVALGGAMLIASARDADAKTTFDSPYTLEQTYNAALRLVRVDMGLKVTERDPQAGYVLFEYKSTESGQNATAGSIEMIPAGSAVKVVLQINAMPHYHEQVMRDHLAQKLRDEYGEPPREAAKPKPDAGTTEDGGA